MFKVFTKKLNKNYFNYLYVMKFSILSLIFTVFLFWLTMRIDVVHEMYIAYALILTVGILHGSNDLSLISYLTREYKYKGYKLLSAYLGLIGLTALLFSVSSLLALMAFILFSCYHFGEQHFHNQFKQQNFKMHVLYLGYGMLIFGLLFYFNKQETSSIIIELTGFTVYNYIFDVFLIFGIVLSFLSIYLNRKGFRKKFNYFQELFLIFLFAILFKMASLLWGFTIYFIVWHSLPSLRDQTYVLYGKLDKASYILYFKSSVLYWMVSILGLVVVLYISHLIQISFITLFFVFLAGITIPHVVVMHYVNKK